MARVAIVTSDLITATRIADAARAAGHSALRVDHPAALAPAPPVDVVFIDWGSRSEDWSASLRTWLDEHEGPRLVVFGPHADLEAHAEARAAGLNPMLARSQLFHNLAKYF